MAYIGKTPASAALTSSDISDGIISTAKIADDAATADKIANAVNSAITANTSKTTNATHSGEVTGSGALTIAGNVVDEANLKVSNSPTNGYMLTAQSGNTGGLTWVAAPTGFDATPNFYAYLSSNQSFGTGTSTKIAFDAERYDSANGFNTSNHEYTVPSGQNGKWFIYYQARKVNFSGARFFADLFVGSTNILSSEEGGSGDSDATTYSAAVIDLNAGDVLSVKAYFTDSGTRSINGQSKSTFIGGYKLV